MLYFFGITHKFISFMQSGMYFDFIIKKFSEIFVKNILISGATFFCEKFLVEFISRKLFDNFTLRFSLWVINRSFELSSIFYIITCIFILLGLVAEFWFLFLF